MELADSGDYQGDQKEPLDIISLLTLIETLLGEQAGAGKRLCDAVTTITQQRALLTLHLAPQRRMRLVALPLGARRLAVAYGERVYGALLVPSPTATANLPALTSEQARQLTRICGALLYLLEQAALIRVLSHHLDLEAVEPLTPRQQEVLALMAQGRSDEEITKSLCISPETLRTHRQAIAARLGATSRQEVLLAAYQAQVVSFLPTSLASEADITQAAPTRSKKREVRR